MKFEVPRWAWPLAICTAYDLGDTAAKVKLFALLDSHQPGRVAPMLRAERDLARARLAAREGADGAGAAFAAVITGLRATLSTPYHLARVVYVPLSVRLGTGSKGYSYLLAASALGGVLGAGLANRLSGASRLAPVIMGSICLQAFPWLVTIPVRSPALAAALQAASGVGMIIVDVLAITILRRDLPGHVLGLPTLLRADRASAAVAQRLRPRVELLSALDSLLGPTATPSSGSRPPPRK